MTCGLGLWDILVNGRLGFEIRLSCGGWSRHKMRLSSAVLIVRHLGEGVDESNRCVDTNWVERGCGG